MDDQNNFVSKELDDIAFDNSKQNSNSDQLDYLRTMEAQLPRVFEGVNPQENARKHNMRLDLEAARREIEHWKKTAEYWERQYNDGTRNKMIVDNVNLNEKTMREAMKAGDCEKFTEEQYAYMVRKTNNQAYAKELMRDCRAYQRSLIDNNLDKYYGSNKGLQAHAEAELGAGSASRYQYYTINFKEEVEQNVQAIMAAIAKACARKWVKRYMYCVEQRGTLTPGDEKYGRGVHTHMLLEKAESHIKKKMSQCVIEIKTNFRELCLVDAAGPFDYKYDAFAKENWVNYIKGIKKDGVKAERVKADKHWRENHLRIPDCLGNWDQV